MENILAIAQVHRSQPPQESHYNFSYEYLHWNAINSRKRWQTYIMFNNNSEL